MRRRPSPLLAVVFLLLAVAAGAQAPSNGTVPPVIKVSGTIAGAEGHLAVTFTLYVDQAGGAALWSERQLVEFDANGRYVVVLGSTTPGGVPPAVFGEAQARWLGAQVDGRAEEPRFLIVSVPYALKAGDAATIAGKPLSAFLLAGEQTGTGPDGLTYVNTKTLGTALGGAFTQPTANAGTANYLGKFTNTTDLGNSALYQAGTSIGLNTLSPEATLHVKAPAAPSAYFDVYNNLLGALPVVYRAARGTPTTPAAVQTDDILGGLAVRGYGTSGFSLGRGQIMFRAAEHWTDAANGTYLQFTTTPLGSGDWQERMRIDPAGNVGIGTTTPAQKLSVAGTIQSTTGGFKFPDGTMQTTAATGGGSYVDLTTSQTIGGTKTFTNAIVGTLAGSITGNAATVSNGVYTTGNYADPSWLTGLSGRKITTPGTNNLGVGTNALQANTSGTANTAGGAFALWANTTGASNTAFGGSSLASNVGGSYNSAFGVGSLSSGSAVSYNTAIGVSSLSQTTGSWNTALGHAAGDANVAGQYNTFLGAKADVLSPGLTNAAAVGYFARVSASNTMVLGGTGANALGVVVGDTAPAPAFAGAALLTLRKDVPSGIGPTLTLVNSAGNAGAGGAVDFYTTAPGSGVAPGARVQSLHNNNSADLVFSTRVAGTSVLAERMRLMNDGRLGIGTNTPASTLEVAGGLVATAGNTTTAATGMFVSTALHGTGVQGVANVGASAWGVHGTSGSGNGVVGSTEASTGAGGWFVNSGGGRAIVAAVNAAETMNVDAAGVHAGPGMTPTPIAHGFFSASGVRVSGSSNMACAWDGGNGRYACTIAGESYYYSSYTAIVTPGSGPYLVGTGSGNGQLLIAFWDLSGATVSPATGFAVVVFKQ